MALQLNTIEAIRNRKTQKFFIVLDDTLEGRYRLVNPQGEIIVLPDSLFEEETATIATADFANTFAPEQLDGYAKHIARLAAEEERAKRPPAPTPVQRIVSSSKTPNVKRSKAPKQPVRTGVGSTWTAPRLSFYRHKIEPLHNKQSFKVTVDGIGDFVITKEEFLSEFNDVIMSPSYRSDGLFTYREVPDKAKKYLRN